MNRVKLEFSALRINSHPFTEEMVDTLVSEAYELFEKEQTFLETTGKDIDDFDIDKESLLKPIQSPSSDATGNGSDSGDPKLHNVVMKAKGMNYVKKAVQNYRENYTGDNQSKACVIL